MAKYNTSTPSGFPEFTPAQERVRQQWLAVIRRVFDANGFLPIETPLVERVDNLLGKGGNPKEMYALKRVLDEDGDDSHSGNGLRFDLTVPLALYVARHQNELAFPFKRYAIGPVFRGERAQKGRFRQFDQCDIDVIGSGTLSLANDALVAAVIVQIFDELAIGDFVVRINNRKILQGMYASVGITNADDMKRVMDSFDDIEKLGIGAVSDQLSEYGLDTDIIQKLVAAAELKGDFSSVATLLRKDFSGELLEEGLSELEEVFRALAAMGITSTRYRMDMSIVRGLDYYTGTVYETNLLNADGTLNTALGSICSGGRYADLAKIFTGKDMPGVGISIGLTRLLSRIFDAGIVKADRASVSDVLVIPLDAEATAWGYEVLSHLQASGVTAEIYLEDKKIPKRFEYADKLGIPYCAVLGEDEVRDGTVTLKNLVTGEQKTVKLAEVTARIQG